MKRRHAKTVRPRSSQGGLSKSSPTGIVALTDARMSPSPQPFSDRILFRRLDYRTDLYDTSSHTADCQSIEGLSKSWHARCVSRSFRPDGTSPIHAIPNIQAVLVQLYMYQYMYQYSSTAQPGRAAGSRTRGSRCDELRCPHIPTTVPHFVQCAGSIPKPTVFLKLQL